ncbi:M20/M25/M40 family metallo-hydrolase [Pedobacter sp. JCM 36344]|uniref:M20/M25/M40 family metallo-hydrolase n=1 Tax=Pedobacter sp. JCM 36344 TaxID=3374280 RepID=UPI00397B225B
MKKITYLVLLLFVSHQTYAQTIEQIISKEYVERLIKTLSSDDMQGRATFTPGIDKAAKFIESEFKSIGLKPLTDENGLRQSFSKIQLKPSETKVTINGKLINPSNVMVSGNTSESLSFDQSSNTPVVNFDASKSFMEQFRPISRSGKKQIVMVNPSLADDFNRIKVRLDQGSIVDQKNINSNPNVIVFILDESTSVTDYKIELKNTLLNMPLFNVAGMIPGKSKAKEIVVFSGHYDHLGIIKSVEQDSIANGADDDASGITGMIALAKYYKKLNNNERTLVFVAFTAEEIGGYGSQYFSSKLNPDNVTAMFNIEMIGKDSKFGPNTAYITGFEKSDFGAILQKNLKGTEFTFHPDPYPSQQLFYRSDNATLAALGVPAHTISTVQIDGDKLYHTVKDEFSSLDVNNILSTIRGIAKSAVTIVKGSDTPMRIPKLSN